MDDMNKTFSKDCKIKPINSTQTFEDSLYRPYSYSVSEFSKDKCVNSMQ